MNHLLQFALDDGTSIYVEADRLIGTTGQPRVTRGGSPAEQAESRFVDAISRVRPAAEAVLQAFRELNTPDEIGLEFGIKFNAQAGAFIASVDSEATFKVSLKWANKK